MIPLHHDPWFNFRFAEDRIIPRFHLEGIEAGRRVSVFKIDPTSGERLGLLATTTVGDGGWVDLAKPIIIRAGDAFVAVPEAERTIADSAPARERNGILLMSDFYDRMANLYHLIFQDWNASIERQAGQLASIIEEHWGPGCRTVLDVSCGIGTQAIGLAERGFVVTASDLSAGAISRAKAETQRRSLQIDYSVCDMRAAHEHHQRQFDVVISGDNSITHLLSDDDTLLALRQIFDCTRPGGGCLLTVRDYDREERGSGLVKPFGVREEGGKRYIIFQVWDFVGEVYDLAMYFVVDDRASEQLVTHVMRTQYRAVGTDYLLALMRRAGFTRADRLDGRFYQPVLVGSREG